MPNAPHDPMDKAYAEAEAMLSDEAERAARRARVLAAAAQATPQAESLPPRPAWRRGGWLVAAGVGGLSLLVATQIRPPIVTQPPPTTPAASPVKADEELDAPPPMVADASGATPRRAPGASIAAPKAPSPAPEFATLEPPPPPASSAPPAPPPPAPPPPPPSSSPPQPPARARDAAPAPIASAASSPDSAISEVVVTGSRIEAERNAPAATSAFRAAGGPAARLRDAAARGRTAELRALLARGVPVDAVDDAGETALMKSVRANQPGAAALLRRYGASLDRKNQAGETARDLAAALGDAQLNRALDLDR